MTTLTTGDNKFGPSRWYVSSTLVDGCTHTSIQSAINSASAGDDVFIKPGTYTENPTLKTGVNLVGFKGDDTTPCVTIVGNCTYAGGGSVSLSNLRLETNSAACLTFSGSTQSFLYLDHCAFNVTNSTGIIFSNSNPGSVLNLSFCTSPFGSTSEALFAVTAAGLMNASYCTFLNDQGLFTASTISSGTCVFYYSQFEGAIVSSSSGTISGYYSQFNGNPGGQGAIPITTGGNSGINMLVECVLNSSASGLSVGSGTTVTILGGEVISAATNAITGSGTLNIGTVTFGEGASSTINTTTVNYMASSPVSTSSIINTGISAHKVLVGEGSSPIVGVAPSSTSGVPLISQGSSSDPAYGTAVVAGGGTGVTSFTDTNSLVISGTTTTGSLQDVASVATGQVLTSAGTSTAPAWSATPSVTSITLGGGTALGAYAEGTWTPTIAGSSTAGSASGGAGFGSYRKIGKVVIVTFTNGQTLSGAAGNQIITGLPFTVANTSNVESYGVTADFTGQTLSSGYTYLLVVGTNGGTSITISQGGTGKATEALPVINGAQFWNGSLIYTTTT